MNKKGNFKLTILLCVFIFFAVVNNTMFNVAIPFIQNDYTLSSGEVSLVSVIYLAVFAVGTLIYGKLAEFLPLRRLYMIGASLLIAGSLIGYASFNYPVLLIGRVIQASGGAAIPSLTMLAFNQFYSADKRAIGMTLLASSASLGTGAGPILGGFITFFIGYKFLFVLTALSIVLLPFLYHLMPAGQKQAGVFDAKGCLLFAAGIFFMVVGISTQLTYLVWGLMLLAAFAFYLPYSSAPFIDVRLVKNKLFCVLLIIALLSFLVSVGNLFLLPMMLKKVNLLTADMIGLLLMPGAVTAFFAGKFVKKFYDRFGAMPAVGVIVLVLMAGFFFTSVFIGQSYFIISALAILSYVGFGGIQVVLGNYMFEVLPQRDINVGMGLYNLCTFVGGALGPALSAKFLDLGLKPFLNKWNHTSAFCDSFMLLAMISALALFTVLAANYCFLHKEDFAKDEY